MSDFDRYLSEWLADSGPHDVPGHVVETALATATTTRRDRPLPGILGRLLSAEAPERPWAMHQPLAAWVALAALLAAIVAMGVFAAVGAGGDKPANGLLAFDRGGDIWVAAPDGSGLTQLTRTEAAETNPVWSPDGTRLAVWVTAGTTATVEILAADGSVVRTVGAPGGGASTSPGLPWFLPLSSGIVGWSPDGRTIVLPIRTSSVEGGVTRTGIESVGLLDLESGEVRQLDPGGGVQSFGIDPTGTLVGIWHDAGPGRRSWIGVTDLEGRDSRHLYEGFDIGWASFTPDGRAITFHAAPAALGAGDIVYLPLEAGEPRVLVDGPTNDVAPSVSPDGQWLAFSRSAAITTGMAFYSYREGASHLYVVPVAAGEPRLVGTGLYPGSTWSPDGTRLAAWAFDGQHLLIMPTDGNGDPVYIPTPDNNSWMSWQQVWPKR